jgi:predicted patatin/cPLA2 family phospholipase
VPDDSRSVIDILRRRVLAGSRQPHGDGASVALAVEGGAMRGVISAGMLSALETLGYLHAFDAVYGASAGAINAAYFLAGQAGIGTTIYHEDINNRRFIDLSRPLRGRPIVDLAFLLDEVAGRRKPLDVERVISGASSLRVLATDVAAERACVLEGFTDAAGLLGALRAGATMPVIAGTPFEYRTRRFLDASLTEPIPVPTAEADGHTHVVALLTRSGTMRPNVSAFDRYFVGPRLRRVSPTLAVRYLTRAVAYAEILEAVDAGTGPLGRAHVLAIRARGGAISKLECREEVLQAGARGGFEAVMETFDPGGRGQDDHRPGC